MKVAVMTDSTAYIPKAMRDAYGIHMVPLGVIFGDETYQEEVDLTTEEFYQKIKDIKELPTTSQPPIGLITEKLEALRDEYDAVVSVHLSSGISGTYQAVVSAGDMVEGIDVYAFDSEISCMAQGFYALEAAEMAKENKTPEQIIARLEEMKKTMHGYFMVDDLTNLHRGGRLNGAQALVGSLLQVKPVLHFVDKVIVPFEKIRTRKKALNRIIGMLEEDAQEGKVAKVVFVHANDEQAAMELKEEFNEKYPDTEALISYFGPVIGTHVGEGAIGVCWYYK
ncbi:DegV family protein [Ornithinibacillus contaminans]|uniref:DegV family protein n=1 Tax=Ornithinibacillus contaminans TaxID=694055 RepID=UPI00064DA6ED|nr:DegV family protein [Ornithinibacillus contaminans]